MRTKFGIWKILAVSMAVGTISVGCGGGDSESSTTGGYNFAGAGGDTGTAGTSGGGAAGKSGTAGSAGKAGAGASGGNQGGSAGSSGASQGGKGGTESGGSSGSQGGTGGKAGAGNSGNNGGSSGTGNNGGSGGSTAGSAGAGNTGNNGGSGGSTAGSAGAGNTGNNGGSGGTDVGGSAGAGNTGNNGGSGGTDVGGSAGAGNTGNNGGSGGSTAGSAGAGNTGNTGGTTGTGGNCGIFGCAGAAGDGGTGGSAGNQGACLHNDPNVDFDQDGYFPPDDCNDCDPNTNPGALDILNVDVNGNALPADQQVDEDCSGAPTLPSDPPTCDTGAFAVTDPDPNHGANAADICQTATTKTSANGKTIKTPGVISAAYTQINGNTPIPPGGETGYGILTHFGTNVNPQLGKSFLVLSSGTARNPTDPGYDNPSGASKGYDSSNPVGFPLVNACGNTADLHDSAALKLKLRAPTNAHSFSFKFKFYTYEFPQYVCTQYNDVFIAAMNPPPPDPKVKADMNISFDPQGNPLSVNAAFLDVCQPGTQAGGKTFDCPAGITELNGTGYEMHGGTTWLQTNAPVNPGEEFTLTFAIADSGDNVLASTVIIDDFQWSANAGEVNTGNACLLGGTGTCAPCLGVATNAKGCCVDEYDACTSDNTSGGCNKLLSCITLCNGNAGCEDQCHASHAAGEPAYDTLFKCLYGDPADAKNLGACGVACKGP